jgi:small subunit ribosomal protein S18
VYYRERFCYFCKKRIKDIDFTDGAQLSRYLTPWGKIKAAKDSGTCPKHQRRLSRAIKKARQMAILSSKTY